MKQILFGLYAAITIALLVWAFKLAVHAPAEMMQGRRIPHHLLPCAFGDGGVSLLCHLNGGLDWLPRASRKKRRQGTCLGRMGCFRRGSGHRILHHRAHYGAALGLSRRGIWWAWDARLTTTLLLWLIYVSYLLTRRFASGPQMRTSSAVLGIFGGIAVPIVYIANRIPGQHPGPVFGGDRASGMDPVILRPFLWNIVAWLCWGVLVLILRHQFELKQQATAAIEAEQSLNA